MIHDPYTLIVALDKNHQAKGTLFIDDEKSYKYRSEEFIYTEFTFKEDTLRSKFIGTPKYSTKSWLERVVIVGLDKQPKLAKITYDGKTEELEIIENTNGAFTVRKPGSNMAKEFTIQLIY